MSERVSLQGRVALVTGGGAGAGRAVALALGSAGAAVAVCDVNPDRADAVAASIVSAGGAARGLALDTGNKFQVATAIEQTRDWSGGLHIVVSAWQVNRPGPFLTLDEYDWRRVIEVNLTGAFLVCQLAARVMADEGGGVIVLLGAALAPTAGQAPYTTSLGGLDGLAAAMAAELPPLGVAPLYIQSTADDAATAARVLREVGGAFSRRGHQPPLPAGGR